jgi:hypothetical protein
MLTKNKQTPGIRTPNVWNENNDAVSSVSQAGAIDDDEDADDDEDVDDDDDAEDHDDKGDAGRANDTPIATMRNEGGMR